MLQNPIIKYGIFLALAAIICYITLILINTQLKSSTDNIEVVIKIKNHIFHPSEVKVPTGKKIIIIVENQDDTLEEFESIDLNREKVIPAHGKRKIVLAPLAKGQYNFFGDFHQETAQGILIVE